jgi:hypothetical protein
MRTASLLALLALAPAARADFAADVAPVLERHCVRCHQPGNAKGEFALASEADLKASGHVVPGKPDQSELLRVVVAQPGETRPRMPKSGKPLTEGEVAALRKWIADGAKWPANVTIKERARAGADWWALQPIAKPKPPAVPDGPQPANAIDHFTFAKLREKGLAPNPGAEKRALIRRLTYDLTGLPPTPDETEAFEKDAAPDAYEKLVDRLLASPRYGEQWGRHWLDVVRFGESNGYERNVLIPNVWPFRDYVIKSFNADKPFDKLVYEHLAGDVVAKGDPEREVGTAFLVCGPYDNVGNGDAAAAALIRANHADEMIRTTTEAFLGLTFGCARCHDHKFDPIAAKDYYALYSTFAGVKHGERALAAKGAKVFAGTFDPNAGRDQKVFVGGDPQKPGAAAPPASMAVLDALASKYAISPTGPESDRRFALARWITAKDNPLTARVLANRVWHWHFGTGIVDTPSDFGWMGGRPTHPELLDFLASELHANGWKLKPLHKLVVMSHTYRQSSAYREPAAKLDADARLLWRFPPRRLSGEEVRDTMLALGGKLDHAKEKGGPGFKLYRYVQDNVATYHPLDEHGPDTYRRAVYHTNARAARVDVLSDFDCPDPAAAAPRRASTTTPLQALALLNHKFVHDMAGALAARAEAEAGAKPDARVRRAFLIAYGRTPTETELKAAVPVVEKLGLKPLCLALLNSNELLYLP